jgi:hypothetical protein
MAGTVDNFKVLKRLSIYVEDIMGQTISYLTTRFNQSRTVFTAASPFGQLLLVLENLTQLVFYYVEDSITELNINEATRLTSVYSLATLAGHNPSRSVSSIGEVSFKVNSNVFDAPFDFAIIPNQTRLRCLNNGLIYILDLAQDEARVQLNGSTDSLKFSIRQGIIETQKVFSKGYPMESFSIASAQNFYVDNFYVNVYVNGEKWKKYESILDMPRGEKAYLIKTGITSGIDLFFGNGNYGKIPPKGSEVIVEYIVNEGVNGNIRTNDPSQVKFEFVDPGFSILGEEVVLGDYFEIVCTQSPFFGTNPEDSELTRLIAPRTSKSFALVNADHYEILLRKLRLFSTIKVFLDKFDNRILNLFLIPDIRKTFNIGQDYFNADLDRFILTNYQKNELLKFIEKSGSKLISTDIRIIDPIPSIYALNISIVIFDDVDQEIIKQDILNRIGNFFIQTTRRNRIPKSDLIKVVEEVNGVDSVSVYIVSKKNEESKILNPSAQEIGLDAFNDIIIEENELPLVRGGFTDRYGNVYLEGISKDSLGAVNISVKSVNPRPIL